MADARLRSSGRLSRTVSNNSASLHRLSLWSGSSIHRDRAERISLASASSSTRSRSSVIYDQVQLTRGSFLSAESEFVRKDRARAIVADIVELTPTIKLVTLRAMDPPSFLPGQFMGVYDPRNNENQDNQTSIFPGTFSIASAPHMLPLISFAVGEDQNPRNMRHFLYFHAVPGKTMLELDRRGSGTVAITPRMVMTPAGGPGGVLLIGGGTAVMGLVSIVEEFLNDVEGLDLPSIELLHSNRSNDDIPFLERMRELESIHPTFHYLPCITGELADDEKCVGYQGRINRQLLAKKIPGNRLFVLCGSGVFCEAIVDMLLDLGVWPGSIRTDYTTRVDPARRLYEAVALQQQSLPEGSTSEPNNGKKDGLTRKARFAALADGTQAKGNVANDGDEYLANYGLWKLLDGLENRLREETPDFPLQFLIEELKKQQDKLPEVTNINAADPSFWMSYWESDTVTWQAPVVSPWLERHLDAFLGFQSRKKIFVPLCGKSLDMKLLADLGHQVIGAECSGIACSDFFKENNIPGYVSETLDHPEGKRIVVHKSTELDIQIYECDIFDLTPSIIGGKVDAILDRAALVALHPSLIEEKYLPLLTDLLAPAGSVLFASVSGLPFPKAPPHMWETKMIERLLDQWFEGFELLEVYRYRVNAGEVVEPIYLLTGK